MAKSDEPQCTKINVQASVGGKVTIINYDVSANYGISESREYIIPEGWTDEQVQEFQQVKHAELYDHVDRMGQVLYDELVEQSTVFDDEGRYVGKNA